MLCLSICTWYTHFPNFVEIISRNIPPLYQHISLFTTARSGRVMRGKHTQIHMYEYMRGHTREHTYTHKRDNTAQHIHAHTQQQHSNKIKINNNYCYHNSNYYSILIQYVRLCTQSYIIVEWAGIHIHIVQHSVIYTRAGI